MNKIFASAMMAVAMMGRVSAEQGLDFIPVPALTHSVLGLYISFKSRDYYI